MTIAADKNRKHIDELHFENKLHLNQLNFYKQEIEIFKHRLEEIAAKNSKTEVTASVEQFQNQFIRQLEVNDELRHKINLHEKNLVEYAKENPVAVDHVLFENNDALGEEAKRYTELYTEMKNNFNRFLSEWM
jgi:molybdenum cofactor biosynthesis enzyme MoaA